MLKVHKVYQQFDHLPVLENISFHVDDDEIVAIIGPSGCGKSTLLNIISRLQAPKGGNITISSERKAFVFQDDRLLPWLSVWDNIRIVRDDTNEKIIQDLIRDVGLTGFEKYKPHQLSGGMKKRCGIARAFYYNGKLLLMDEPFQGLDYCLRQEMLHMLMAVWLRNKQSVLFITHEIDEALKIAGRILVLSDRPSTIIQEYVLPPYEKRELETEILSRIRREIICSITK